MREIGQGTVPTVDTDHETFASLRLAEPSERVRITLDERMLSIQGKRHATVDVRLSAIHTMKHHSTHLAPFWMLILGLAMVWIGYRLMVPPLYRLAFMGSGASMILARFLTNQPTLTIQTSSGDTHVLFGNERKLNRLSFMFHQLANNKSLAEVRRMLQSFESGENPSWDLQDVLPAPDLPVVVHTPSAVDRFLSKSGVEVEEGIHDETVTPDWMPTNEPEPTPPSQFTAFIPAYVSSQTTASSERYPPDHRPAPVNRSVLMPADSSPPMHQTVDGRPFFPSFLSAQQAHIPGLMPDAAEEEETSVPVVLDAELVEEASPQAETPNPAEPQPPADRDTLLERRRTPTLADTPFVPRRTRQLHPRPNRQRGMISRLREQSRELLGLAMGPARPSPYASSETTGALRESAEANVPPATEVMDALSQERGGALPPEETARLRARTEQLLAAARDIGEQERAGLDTLSFADLLSSKPTADVEDMPRLDED